MQNDKGVLKLVEVFSKAVFKYRKEIKFLNLLYVSKKSGKYENFTVTFKVSDTEAELFVNNEINKLNNIIVFDERYKIKTCKELLRNGASKIIINIQYNKH